MYLKKYLIDSDKQQRRRGLGGGTAGSLAFHGILVAVFVLAGAQSAKHSVASEKAITAFITQGAAPPPPPPPPPPPKSSGGAKATPKVQQPKPVKITPQTLIAPREIKELPVLKPMTSAMVEEVDLPEVSSLVEADAGTAGGDADAGVPGGVEGGVAGGTVGGVVGGEVGGVIGGQLGGVVGGQIGGTGTGTEGSGTGGPEAPVAPEPPPPPPPPPPAPSGPMRVGGAVKAPVATNRPEPMYTNPARNGRIEGTVVVEAIISKSGNVQDVRVLRGLPMGLSEAAEEAVKKWRFKPGTLNGEPVATIFTLTVTFKLD